MIGHRRFALSVLAAILGVSACAGNDPAPSPAPDLRPVVDDAPYWCEFISQESFRRVTGDTSAYTDRKAGPWKNDGGCLIEGGDKGDPVGVWWSRIDNSAERLELSHENWDETKPTPLPPDLGEGFAAYAGNDMLGGRPYFVISRFSCGGEKPWIGIDLKRVAKGRDAIKDLTDLMRVAQKRYGDLHDCRPSPA